MRHIPAEPPAFFHRGPSPLARLTFFGVLSLALLFADTRLRYLEHVRYMAAVVLAPVQRVLLLPRDAVRHVSGYFTDQQELLRRSGELEGKLLQEAPLVQAHGLLRQENERLKSLLEMQARYAGAATAAEVLYTGRDPFSQKVFVDKGSRAGIRAGEAVIDAEGVVGQVTRVYPEMSEVTLLTDKDNAVPVRVERSGVRSVLFGAGAGRLPELRFVAPSADIQNKDLLVTSGIDGTYPPGLAVGEVASIERETGQMFARILARPRAGVDRSRFLLVLGKVAALPPVPEEPAQAETAKRGKGRSRRAKE
ncbi:MAG: rod shape-determining protein MreC [Pseudomonadota bacterium]|nr:rod shape-determining protein MreC [Pseudomonadota bacterium]